MSCRKLIASSVALALCSVAADGRAQLRGDLGAYGGVSQRVLAGASGGGALPGPILGIEGHLALMPLLRAGAYVHGELAPTNDAVATKNMLASGLRLKLLPPWPRGDFRAWLAVGVGYVAAYSAAYSQPLPVGAASVDSAGGGFVEVPVSLGISYRVRRPFVVFAELTSRFGMGFSGTLYGGGTTRGATTAGGAPVGIASTGTDVFAASLAVGLGFDL